MADDQQKDREISEEVRENLETLASIDRLLQSSMTKFRQNMSAYALSTETMAVDAKKAYTSVKNLSYDIVKVSHEIAASDEVSKKAKNRQKQLESEIIELLTKQNKLQQSTTLQESQKDYEAIKKQIAENNDLLVQRQNTYVEEEKNLRAIKDVTSKDYKDKKEILDLLKEEIERYQFINVIKNADLETVLKRNLGELMIFNTYQEMIDALVTMQEEYNKLIEGAKEREKKEKDILNIITGQSIYSKSLLKQMGLGGGKVGGAILDIVSSFTKFGPVVGTIMLVAKAIQFLKDTLFAADQATTDFARSMSVTKEEARLALRSYERITSQVDGLVFTSRDLAKAQGLVNKELGTSIYLRGNDLVTITKATQLLGLTEDAAGGLAKFAFTSGKSFEDVKNEILGASKAMQIQTGLMFQDKDILEKTLKVTGGMRANFKGSSTEIARAITLAKSLGTTLENAGKTSAFLLDFEQSIASELEAELLMGKALNLERARSAALMGDMKTVMEEVNKQSISFDKFASMNVIAQEKLAGAFGLTRDEYSDMLFEQTALNRMRSLGLSTDQKSLIEDFNRLKASGKDVSKLLGEQVAKRLELQSAEEKYNKVIEKLQTALERFLDSGMLDSIINLFANVTKYFASGGSLFGAMFEDFSAEPFSAESSTNIPYAKTSTNLYAPPGLQQQQPQYKLNARADNGRIYLDSQRLGVLMNIGGLGSDQPRQTY